MNGEVSRVTAYRNARRDFVAASEAAGGDVISRVHPAKGPDGKPLFCDSVALGPRDATRALLLIAGEQGAVTALLKPGIKLPENTRLIAMNAPDPFFSAWGRAGQPEDWPQKTLVAIAVEDLSRVKRLIVLDLGNRSSEPALSAVLPNTAITIRSVRAEHAELALSAAIAAL